MKNTIIFTWLVILTVGQYLAFWWLEKVSVLCGAITESLLAHTDLINDLFELVKFFQNSQ